MKIITNHHIRNFVYGYELTEAQLSDFDHLDDIEIEQFMIYKDNVYHLSEFMPCQHLSQFKSWHRYINDTSFSGILVRIIDDESYQIAIFIS